MEEALKNIIFSVGSSILALSYMVASILFILGLRCLSHPETARNGNRWAATGMLLAIIATLLFHEKNGTKIENIPWIITAIIIGTIIGWIMAKEIKMTAMPQMVSFFNGMGGACAALISMMEFPNIQNSSIELGASTMASGATLSTLLGIMIGSISFTGSLVAFGKLDGTIGKFKNSSLKYFNLSLLALLFAILIFIMLQKPITENNWLVYVFAGLSLIYGTTFVLPIGGADMPVVISLLNSLTGLAVACGGFIYNNQAMITGGVLVGSAGTILTILMCKAMNRSLFNVAGGAFKKNTSDLPSNKDANVKEISLSDAAILLNYSQKVYIIPGYGLAVAQAQHLCHELENTLESRGVAVKYGIHPVAGRMPGHMNVLLAEAGVPYEKLAEMDIVNNELPNTDVAIVIGANDVVNPAATTNPSSPIYGMPVIKVWEAKNIITIKRSMAKGYAAIENDLFYHTKNRMFFGDAKETLQKLITEIKAL